MSDQGSIARDSDQQITFLIKNPSKHEDSYALSVPMDASIADIHRKIAEEYEGKPIPSAQTLIYGGKVLKDPNVKIKDIMKQPFEPNVPHSMHLVIKRSVLIAQKYASSSSRGSFPVPNTAEQADSNGEAPAGSTAAADRAPSASTGSASTSSSHQAAAQPSSTRAEVGASVSGMAPGGAHMYEFGASSPPSSTTGVFAAAASASLPATSAGIPYSYMFLNPVSPVMSNHVMATAYQAAYSAALQSMRHQMGSQAGTAAAESSSSSTAPVGSAASPPHMLPLSAPLTPALLYYPAAYQQAAAAAAMAAAAAAQHGQQGLGAVTAPAAQPQFAMPAPFAVPVVGMPTAMAGHPPGAADQHGAAAAGNAAAAAPAGRAGLRQRLPHRFGLAQGQAGINAGAIARNQQDAAGQQGVDHAHAHGHRRYRTRTITFRISMRTLLQMLVFGMVLYQHCTWPRLCILLAGSVILYATALWAPFRQFILSLAMPPRPEQLAEMQRRRQQQQQQAAAQYQLQAAAREAAAAAQAPANAEPQQQQDQPEQGGGAGAEAGAAPPAPVAAQGVQHPGMPAWLQQGIVREILTVIVSFVTSLLPAWNYNPEDAAVFAAAQDMMAREAREQQQRGGGNQPGENAGGAVDEAAAAAAPVP